MHRLCCIPCPQRHRTAPPLAAVHCTPREERTPESDPLFEATAENDSGEQKNPPSPRARAQLPGSRRSSEEAQSAGSRKSSLTSTGSSNASQDSSQRTSSPSMWRTLRHSISGLVYASSARGSQNDDSNAARLAANRFGHLREVLEDPERHEELRVEMSHRKCEENLDFLDRLTRLADADAPNKRAELDAIMTDFVLTSARYQINIRNDTRSQLISDWQALPPDVQVSMTDWSEDGAFEGACKQIHQLITGGALMALQLQFDEQKAAAAAARRGSIGRVMMMVPGSRRGSLVPLAKPIAPEILADRMPHFTPEQLQRWEHIQDKFTQKTSAAQHGVDSSRPLAQKPVLEQAAQEAVGPHELADA